jgi:hypothetical protein
LVETIETLFLQHCWFCTPTSSERFFGFSHYSKKAHAIKIIIVYFEAAIAGKKLV